MGLDQSLFTCLRTENPPEDWRPSEQDYDYGPREELGYWRKEYELHSQLYGRDKERPLTMEDLRQLEEYATLNAEPDLAYSILEATRKARAKIEEGWIVYYEAG